MLITRVFATPDDAHAAVGELKAAGFTDAAIRVEPAATGQPGTLVPTPVPTMVSVDAPFGTGAPVTRIFAIRRAGETAAPPIVEPAPAPPPPDAEAAPLSTAMGWRLLLDDPTPLATFLGISTLSPRAPSRTWLLNMAAPLSSLLSLKVLWEKPAPLSSLTHGTVLLNDPAPLSSLTRGTVLLNNPAPLSTSIRAPTLWHRAAPLSSLIGLPLLLRKR
jgi:hypothetical protein